MRATQPRPQQIDGGDARDDERNVQAAMERSHNGWPVSPDPDEIGAVWITVATRTFRVVGVAAPLFKYAIKRWHREVSPLTGGVMDEWSYAYRKIPGSSYWSNHASATAVDLDATEFPMHVKRMNWRQRRAVRRIMRACGGQLRWGGEWPMPGTDQMHIELAPGTTPASVRRQVVKMRLT